VDKIALGKVDRAALSAEQNTDRNRVGTVTNKKVAMTEVNGQSASTGGHKKPEEDLLEEHREADAPEHLNIGSLIFGRAQVGPPRPMPTKPNLRGKRRPFELGDNPFPAWMNIFTTTEAAIYCRYKTPQGLRKAWYNMEVFPQGQRGGRKTLMWKRSELDRFLRGEPLKNRKAAGILMPPKMRGVEQELPEVPET
jgi:hypothetical protein